MKIQHEGYAAFLAGKTPKECPYGRATAEDVLRQEAWLRGYAASRTDRARKNKEADSADA